MEHRILLCIPTKGRSETIQEFIDKFIPNYLKRGIDVIFYDSSIDTATKELFSNVDFTDVGSGKVIYKHIDDSVSLPQKVYNIISDLPLLEEYDYLWITNDTLRFKDEGLVRIISSLDTDCDVIVLDHLSYSRKGSAEIYIDKDTFFQECIWLTNLLGSLILNISSMIRSANIEIYKKIFYNSSVENWSINYYCFHRIAHLDKFWGLRLFIIDERVFSYLKKGNFWRKKVFSLLCEEWVTMIETLPECYTNKRMVCRQSAYDAILGDIDLYYSLRMDDIYSFAVFWKYRKTWNKVSYIPKMKLFFLSIVPRILFKISYNINIGYFYIRLKNFFQSRKKIILYGAGDFGYRYVKYCEKNNLSIDGVCVSSSDHEKKFCGYNVCSIADIAEESFRDTGFIVAMNAFYAKEVLSILRIKTKESHIFYVKNAIKIIDYSLDYKFVAGNRWA